MGLKLITKLITNWSQFDHTCGRIMYERNEARIKFLVWVGGPKGNRTPFGRSWPLVFSASYTTIL